jgi:hypothetical protein
MKILVNKEDLNYINESIENGEVLKEDLNRWFKEKWVDVSKKVNGKHPPCGRKKAADGSYPKCRPSKKVSKETPKTANSYTKKEKKGMTNQKRNAEKTHPKSGTGNAPKLTHYNEDTVNNMVNLIIKEVNSLNEFEENVNLMYEQLSDDVTFEDLNSLKKINNRVNRQEVIDWFNQNDIECYRMTDIEMYIMYIEKNMEDMDINSEDEFGSVEETDFIPDDLLNEAEYQGRKVQLGKIMQGDIKKFKVYVKNDKGKVVKVNFGFGGKSAHGKRMVIKKNNPERRKSFRARMNCDNPGPRWKPKYWACKSW